MNVKRYFAKTAREALRMLKDELGPDAVVLSNRAANGGVEILALPAGDVALQRPVAAKPGPQRRGGSGAAPDAGRRPPSGEVPISSTTISGQPVPGRHPAGTVHPLPQPAGPRRRPGPEMQPFNPASGRGSTAGLQRRLGPRSAGRQPSLPRRRPPVRPCAARRPPARPLQRRAHRRRGGGPHPRLESANSPDGQQNSPPSAG